MGELARQHSSATKMLPNSNPNAIRKEIFIAVMGPHGAGKSTFVNLVTKSNKMGHGAEAYTTRIQSSDPIQVLGHRVTLLDIPGFNDAEVADISILRKIALVLQLTREQGFPLSGVVYMHSITTDGMSGSPFKNLTMFHNLCGTEALRNVVVVTTKWETVPSVTAERRERDLLEGKDYFKPFVDMKACIMRHDNCYDSAVNIVRHFINNNPISFRIQKEFAKPGTPITNTSAAKYLQRILKDKARQHYEKQMKKLPSTGVDRGKHGGAVKKLEDDYSTRVDAVAEALRRLERQYATEKATVDAQVATAKETLAQLEAEAARRARRIEKLTKQLKKGKQSDDKERERIKAEIAELNKGGSTSSRAVMKPGFGVLAVVLDIALSTTTGVPVPARSVLNKFLSHPRP